MNVVSMPEVRKCDHRELERRRLAIQIAAQLPEEPAEALLVLAAAAVLVRTFLATGGP